MKNKLLALEKAAGTEKIKGFLKKLEKETDMARFDEIMQEIFDEEYNKQQEFEETIKKDIVEKGFDYKTNADFFTEDKIKAFADGENELKDFEHEQYQGDEEEEETEWWFCDRKLITRLQKSY